MVSSNRLHLATRSPDGTGDFPSRTGLRVSHFPALSELRIGCVKYLNSKPLIAAYPGPVLFDHPSRLAAALHAGKMDAALVPIFEAFSGEGYVAVDGVAIASHGPVYSVFLAYEGELRNVQRIALDPA